MKIIYLSTALSDDNYNSIVKMCKSFKPTFSGVGFDRNVAIGLSEFAEIQSVSRLPIPSWPKYSKLYQKSAAYEMNGFSCYIPGMLDLPVIKEECYYRGTIKQINNIEKKDNTVVVLSGLYRSLLKPALYLKRKYGYRICAIVPDLPELMITYRKDYSFIRRKLNSIDMQNTKKYYDNIDAFVFLSKYMNEAVNSANKPYVIVDGLTNLAVFPQKKVDEQEPYILYAGKVSAAFGVDKLIQAFIMAKLEKNIQLHICGDGDYREELLKIANTNECIIYHGAVPHEEVLYLEVNAALLVDPRPSDTQIVKMSFPSKIIEYMASGTPVLTTNLPCFHEDYRRYQYRIDDESIEGIKYALRDFFNTPVEERKKRGEAARQFILSEKSLSKQCERIMNLLYKIEGK